MASAPKPPTLRRARVMAYAVLEHHFGKAPKRLTHRASGLSNFVFQADHADGEFIVRLAAKPEKINAYIKEQWAIRRVRELGVPTPEVLEVATGVVPMPYMISRRVDGHEATHHPARLDILEEMGRYAALINSVPTTGYGKTFDWSENRLSRNDTWPAFLRDELHLDERLEILRKHRMLDAARLRKVEALLQGIGRKRRHPTLAHGDMRLKNVIVDDAGTIVAIIDWEESCSQIAPYWELSLALHDLSIDAKQAFLEGYGVSEGEIVKMAPALRALNLINYAPAIERMAGRREAARLASYRTRLSGALDLYSV